MAKSDPRGLWDANMDSDQRIRGIARSGSDGSYVYTVVGPNGTNPVGAQSAANRPITFVSWFDSARFANWMANGKVLNPADGTAALALIDNGAYNLGTATTGTAPAKNSINPKTNAPPTFSIPTENEWYNAAYYDPTKDGTGGYWSWATGGFNEQGIYVGPAQAPGNGWNGTTALVNKDLANQASFRRDWRYAVTGSQTNPATSGDQNVLTDVGTFTDSYSYYGAFDMSGNVWDWNDLHGTLGSSRGRRGGAWDGLNDNVSSLDRGAPGAGDHSALFGFRLVSPVPEPATLGIVSTGALCAGGWWIHTRRRRART